MKRLFFSLILLFFLLFLYFTSALAVTQTFAPGAYIINMGNSPQTIANGLKPYGLIYDLVINRRVPLYWAINPGKVKDGVDFSAGGKDYRGGSFIIPSEFISDALTSINTWRTKGVIVDGPVSSTITVPVFNFITSFPNAVMDLANGKLAEPYYKNAEIPSASYRLGDPSSLTACDDVYIMPHADPTYATHNNLISFNNNGGFIWASCHAVSVLENITNPVNPSLRVMNFLSINGMLNYGDHKNGTPPYSYRDPSHPIMQFLSILDGATTNGSEQIYLPLSLSWRPTTTVSVWDPDHPDVPLKSPGEAAAVAYGHGFGISGNGMVMYEGGHTLTRGTVPEQVAAQRALFNFILLAGISKRPEISTNIPSSVESGQSVTVSATVSGGTPPYTFQWMSSCGGAFADPTAPTTTFTAPSVTVDTPCIIRLIIRDACNRFNFDAQQTIISPSCLLTLTKSADKTTANPGEIITYTTIFRIDGGGNIKEIIISDVTPSFTTFLNAEYGTPLPPNLTGCIITSPGIGETGTITWTFNGTLNLGQSGTVTFQVILD